MNFQLTPIGLIHSPHRQPEDTTTEPRWAHGVQGTVEVFPEFAEGLADLDGFDRIWLLYWLDRVPRRFLEVIPYLDTEPRGVFSTRAPSRPNPIGLSCVHLVDIEGALLRVCDLDVLDGTPLLDIKPYLPDWDIYAVDHVGWYAHANGWRNADKHFAPAADQTLRRLLPTHSKFFDRLRRHKE